jgi:glycosyltransferase involved in cell wall biosynthesis
VIDDIIKAGYNKIMIINDGSTDETTTIIEDKIQEYNSSLIIHIKHPINRGDK